MLYTEENVRDNLRNREGKRVFYLGKSDQLTSGARDFLTRERIPILPAEQAKPRTYKLLNGGSISDKPEHMTHLNGDVLVLKTHPRIAFRGAMDTLEAELILCQLAADEKTAKALGEVLAFARMLLRCEVLGEPVPTGKLCGLTPEELRSHSHLPQKFYDQPHFMPDGRECLTLLSLNRLRTLIRQMELSAFSAFCPNEFSPGREDILQAVNRLSSFVYILMIRLKAKEKKHE